MRPKVDTPIFTVRMSVIFSSSAMGLKAVRMPPRATPPRACYAKNEARPLGARSGFSVRQPDGHPT
jgi:hypothetical protein